MAEPWYVNGDDCEHKDEIVGGCSAPFGEVETP